MHFPLEVFLSSPAGNSDRAHSLASDVLRSFTISFTITTVVNEYILYFQAFFDSLLTKYCRFIYKKSPLPYWGFIIQQACCLLLPSLSISSASFNIVKRYVIFRSFCSSVIVSGSLSASNIRICCLLAFPNLLI